MSNIRNQNIVEALAMCGQERVFENSGKPAMVMIVGTTYTEEKIVKEGVDHEAAGRAVVLAFTKRLRERAEAMERRADAIEARLDGKVPPP